MLIKNRIGLVLFLTGLALLLVPSSFNITGNVIVEALYVSFNFLYVLGLILISSSILFFTSRQSLDAIIIPTGGGEFDPKEKMYSQDRDRAEKAIRRKKMLGNTGYFVISGLRHKDEQVKGGQSKSIYKYLRRHGIKPSEIMIEGQSHNTLENVLYTLKKIKEREVKKHGKLKRPLRVAFVSYPEHLRRFEDFEKKAVRKGVFGEKDFKFFKIRTFHRWDERKEGRAEEKSYEGNLLRRLTHGYKLGKVGGYK